jgi:hypothetical protein
VCSYSGWRTANRRGEPAWIPPLSHRAVTHVQCAALSRFDNVFMLMLGPNPAYLTYDFIEEVPEVCRINHEMAQVVRYPSAPLFRQVPDAFSEPRRGCNRWRSVSRGTAACTLTSSAAW